MTARKPPSLKLIAGTSRGDRAAPDGPALPAIDSVPPAPNWLPNAHATREWKRLAPVLVINRLLHAGNISAFAQLCALHGKLVSMWSAGETPNASLLSAYRGLSGELGLLSMSVPVMKRDNRFTNNAKRR